MDLDLDQRLRILEIGSEIHTQILANIQAELIEADRLSNSVERLGDGASELGKALLQVDKNQQALTRLGEQLSDVQAAVVPRDEIEEQAAANRRERRWLIAVAAAVLVTLGVVVFLLSQQAHDACERRQESTRVLVALLRGFQDGDVGDVRIQQGIDRLTATLDRTCDEQYPLHL